MADLAILVVSAVEGVEVQSEATWRLAEELGLPRLVFVNKLDRERADFERTLSQLRDLFGSGIAPLELPIGAEAGFRGVADLLTDTAITYDSRVGRDGPTSRRRSPSRSTGCARPSSRGSSSPTTT